MSQTNLISRRNFIIGTASVSIVALGGGGAYAVRQPAISFVENKRTQPDATQPDATQHILVTYASQYGSTGGVADAISETFYEAGASVDLRQVDHVTDLTAYTAVVVGAPVITEEWMAPAVAFVRRFEQELSHLPTAYFLTCMTLGLAHDETEHGKIMKIFPSVQAQTPSVQPVELGLFAGALDYTKMSTVNSTLYKVFAPDTTAGDYRDWAAIRAWAAALYPRLG